MTKHYYTKGLDIPQDANSVRYPIPEEYIAKIEDGALIIMPKESEDEKFQKYILKVCKECVEANDKGLELSMSTTKKLLAYLEKQKEQKPLPSFDDLTPGERMSHPLYLEGFDVGRKVGRIEAGQKPEWSEEDEKMLKNTIRAFYLAYPYALDDENPRKKNIDWLKSLRPQPKQDWSEEEEKIFNTTITHLLSYAYPNNPIYRKEAEKCVDWLKSLKNRGNSPKSNTNSPSWKPSEEEMNSLRDTIVQTKGYSYSVYLPELYEQLKKLM